MRLVCAGENSPYRFEEPKTPNLLYPVKVKFGELISIGCQLYLDNLSHIKISRVIVI